MQQYVNKMHVIVCVESEVLGSNNSSIKIILNLFSS